jgi:predicted NBD/HSP70 family sugar kinase
MRILVVDVGGTHIKLLATGHKTPIKIPSGPTLTPRRMVRLVKQATAGWKFAVIAIGYPGPVLHGKPVSEPRNLGRGWVGFDFRRAFGRKVKLINDAAMQALGSYTGGRMLFLGLGTGLGSALIVDGVLEPLELAHLPYKKGRTYEDYIGAAALKRFGKKKWRREVRKVVTLLKGALQADSVVVGGGNAKFLRRLPARVRRGENSNAFVGGYRLWARTT